jgi:hypothetical protein
MPKAHTDNVLDFSGRLSKETLDKARDRQAQNVPERAPKREPHPAPKISASLTVLLYLVPLSAVYVGHSMTSKLGGDVMIRTKNTQFSIHRKSAGTTVSVLRGTVEILMASLSVPIVAGHEGQILNDSTGPTMVVVRSGSTRDSAERSALPQPGATPAETTPVQIQVSDLQR